MIYEDDYEFEEQPPHVRDRQIPGKGDARPPVARRRARTERPRAAQARDVPKEAEGARDLLREILERMGVAPIDIAFIPREEGEYFEVTGPDLAALIGRRGNTLEALNHIFNNIINAGIRSNRRYYTIDAEGYRARRADHLKDLALSVLERCVREKTPQYLDPMLPSERKIIHLALANSDVVRTESEGEEPERRVVVFPR
ncbi:MAG: Jag family protein [Candidatus Tyrphobacter sp.]